jgi:hypothetical protein
MFLSAVMPTSPPFKPHQQTGQRPSGPRLRPGPPGQEPHDATAYATHVKHPLRRLLRHQPAASPGPQSPALTTEPTQAQPHCPGEDHPPSAPPHCFWCMPCLNCGTLFVTIQTYSLGIIPTSRTANGFQIPASPTWVPGGFNVGFLDWANSQFTVRDNLDLVACDKLEIAQPAWGSVIAKLPPVV